MKHTHYVQISLGSVCLVMTFLLNSCSIFSPVGHAISQGYENTVTYFNGYYNAKWLFSEAEDEILLDALSKRGKEVAPTTSKEIPGGAKDKLTKVIDKCSNILAFHPTSTLVDDALFLIGKSFYYQMEYRKAERKFAELLAQYPHSSLVLETQLWYGRTEEKLGKLEEGIRLSEVTISAAQAGHDTKIEAQARQLLGSLYRRTKQDDKAAIEYQKVVAFSNDEESKANAQISLGDIYFSNKQYDKAAEAYLRTEEFSSDSYLKYYSKLQASIAYREIGEYSKGLNLTDGMIEDFRNKEYLPALLFERANNYLASGKHEDAIDEYVYVDTTYARSECATRSAYQLGKIYEQENVNYLLALKYYTRVNLATGLDVVADGHRKYSALIRYFDARQRLVKADSLMAVLMDTTRKINTDTLAVTGADTTQHKAQRTVSQSSSIDSVTALKLIAEMTKRSAARVASRSLLSNTDSLAGAKSQSNATQPKVENVVSQPVIPRADSLKAPKPIPDTTQHKDAPLVIQPALSKADSLKAPKPIPDTTQHKGAPVVTQPTPSKAEPFKASKFVPDTTLRKGVPVVPQPALSKADSLKVSKSISDTTLHKGVPVVTQPALTKVDSLKKSKFVPDTTLHKGAPVVPQPSLSKADSLKVSKSISDTTQHKDVQVTSQSKLLSADSINVLKSIAAQELGDIFYSEIVIPDSAFYWYNNSLMWNDHPNRSPRILYILAELSRVNPEKKFPIPEEYHKRLDHDYPESIYAEEARRFLGKTSSISKADTAAEYYERAEKQIDTKQYGKAVKTLRTIVKSYSKSPLAAKSEYAIGWIFENHLAQPESAIVQYKHIVKNYEGTTYALAAANQIEGALQAEAAKLDSAKMIAAKLDSITNAAKLDSVKMNAAKLDSAKINTAKKDTSQINATSMDTTKITTTKIDTSKINTASMDTSNITATKIDSSKIKPAKIDTSKIKSTNVDVSKIKSTKADTSKVKTVKMDTSKIKTTKIDTSGIIRNQMNQKLPNPEDAKKDTVDSIRK